MTLHHYHEFCFPLLVYKRRMHRSGARINSRAATAEYSTESTLPDISESCKTCDFYDSIRWSGLCCLQYPAAQEKCLLSRVSRHHVSRQCSHLRTYARTVHCTKHSLARTQNNVKLQVGCNYYSYIYIYIYIYM